MPKPFTAYEQPGQKPEGRHLAIEAEELAKVGEKGALLLR